MKYFVISGNVGVGKTTLAEALSRLLPLEVVREDIARIPFLGDCYKDMSRWAFSTQVAFYVHSFTEVIKMQRSEHGTFCLDNTVMAHHHVFTRYLRMKGYLTEQEYNVCAELFEGVMHCSPSPVLLIYLKGPAEILLERIKRRGREHERSFTREFLEELDELFGEWIESYNRSPILRVNAEALTGRIADATQELARTIQGYL